MAKSTNFRNIWLWMSKYLVKSIKYSVYACNMPSNALKTQENCRLYNIFILTPDRIETEKSKKSLPVQK